MRIKAKEIADILGGSIEGDPNVEVYKPSKIEEGSEGGIAFLSNPKYRNYLYNTSASVVLVNIGLELEKPVSATLIRVPDAYKSFVSLLNLYQDFQKSQKQGIETPSFLSSGTVYGEGFYLGMFSYIGENVSIGKNVKIYPQAFIGDHVIIGDDVVIHPGVKIYSHVEIGNRCVINSGCVIGADGFGFIPDENHRYKKIPHLGKVILEDDVDLGSCVTIDRATMGATILKRGVKVDNQVQIAHNVSIEEDTVIAAQSGIAGSVKIGKRCRIGGQVGIAGHVKIADNTTIQAQSGVTKETKEGSFIQGSPAFGYKDYNKSYVYFRSLPRVVKEIKDQIEKNAENNY